MDDSTNISASRELEISRDGAMSQTKIELAYERGAHLFSSRCSEGFEAIQKADRAKCLLWILRYPIKTGSPESKQLLSRVDKIRNLRLPLLNIVQYGLDPSGVAFLLTEYEKLTPVIDSSWIPVELEERFLAAAKAVEIMHKSEIILGDFGEHTFLLKENAGGDKKSLVIGPILGDFDFAAQNTAQLPPSETLRYLAPERSVTARPDIASDIFALGIFAYRLFTGEYPTLQSTEAPKKPSTFRSDLPVWVDPIIGNCLLSDPSKRFANLGVLISKIEESIKSGKMPEVFGIWSKIEKGTQQTIEKQSSKELIKVKPKQTESVKEKVVPAVAKNKTKTKQKEKSPLIWVFAIAMGLGIAGFVFLSIGSKQSSETKLNANTSQQEQVTKDSAVSDPIVFIAEYAPENLKPLIIKLADPAVDLEQRNAALIELMKSQDSVVFEVLANLIQGNLDLKLKTEAKKFLIERVELSGLTTTSGLIQDWIAFQTQISPAANLIFRAVDRSRSVKTRTSALIEAYAKDPILSLKFSAALGLDEDETIFVDTLKILLSKEQPNEDFNNLGIGALLLSHPSFSIFLDRNITKAFGKFSDRDLTWSLLKAAESDRAMLKELAQEIIRRNIFSPYQMYFIGVLTKNIDPGKTSHVFDRELVLAALGKVQSADLYNFAKWDSVEAEKVLLVICASSPDANISKEAFDILAAKSLNNKLAAGLIAWVKGGFWEYRARIARAIAVISMADLAQPEELSQALDSLMPFAKGGLFKIIASSEDITIVKGALARMGALLSNEDLQSLLLNPNSEIRIEAVKSLKNRNELEVLRAIVKAYDDEKDLEVRKVYNEYHWVTKNRSNKGF